MATAVQRLFNKDTVGGFLLLVLGVWAAAQGSAYQVGTLHNMGPGFFPLSLGVVLALLGAIMIGSGVARPASDAVPRRRPEWRGWACLCAAIGAFMLLGRYGGLLPATFTLVFIAARGDRRNTLRDALMLGVAAGAVATGVFWYALQVQFPLLSWG